MAKQNGTQGQSTASTVTTGSNVMSSQNGQAQDAATNAHYAAMRGA